MRQKGLTEMKNDSNMFNDNSIETEGVPADKTAEIPKVVDSTEEENAKKPLVLFGREFSRKQVCVAGAGILCAALLIGGGAYVISHASWTGDSNAPAVSQSKDEEKQDMVLILEVKADGWDADTSTPVIAHIEDADGKVVNIFQTNISSNPNADADAVEKETGKAEETAKEDKSDAKTPETSDNKKNDSGNNGSGNKSDSKPSGGSGNSGSGSSSGGSSKKDDTTAHQHKWVAQTKTVHHDAQYKTVHHDAVTHQVWHDAVTEEHYICNQCGADITSDPWGHLDAYDHGGYHSSYVTVKQGYYETVTDKAAYDEQVQVSAAWDETVTTGYKCSSCGATK